MHVVKLLHKLLGKSYQNIDKRIIRTLFEASETLTRCRKLSIAGIGRSLCRSAKIKHTIKCIDRLFGNKSLHKKTPIIYKGMTKLLLNKYSRPLIAIDWSGLTRCGEYHFLRAALPVGGRTLTIYEQAYHISEYGKAKTYKEFLLTVQKLLPSKCHPIIVSDAGFRNNWFRLVTSYGWDFVGRARHNTHYKINEEWQPIKELYAKACCRAKFLGEFLYRA